MAVIRQGAIPENHYSLIPNDLSRRSDLSLQAKGLYVYLRSHRDGWEMSTQRIGDALGIGRNTVSKYVRELEDVGYLIRESDHDEEGKFSGVVYIVNTDPLHKNINNGKSELHKSSADHCTDSVHTPAQKHRCPKTVQHKKTNSLKKTSEKTNEKMGARKRATPAEIESDWRPTDSQWQRHVENHPLIDHEAELRKFRIWNENNRKKRVDWNRAFGNWLIRAKPERESWSQLFGVDYSETEEVKPF